MTTAQDTRTPARRASAPAGARLAGSFSNPYYIVTVLTSTLGAYTGIKQTEVEASYGTGW